MKPRLNHLMGEVILIEYLVFKNNSYVYPPQDKCLLSVLKVGEGGENNDRKKDIDICKYSYNT